MPHIQWCMQRANEYFDDGDVHGGFMSFLSDVRKDPTTAHAETRPLLMACAASLSVEEARVVLAMYSASYEWVAPVLS